MPSRAKPLPSADYLSSRFAYDPVSGDLIWLPISVETFADQGFERPANHLNSWNSQFAGKVAGGVDKEGYVSIRLDLRRVYAHRVIWKMVNGIDAVEVDHIDHVRSNNRLENLRDVTSKQNAHNRLVKKTSMSGLKGAFFARDRWISYIHVDGRNVYLGAFKTPDEAHQAYVSASLRQHGEFSAFAA